MQVPSLVSQDGNRLTGACAGGAPSVLDEVEPVADLRGQPELTASDLGQPVGILHVADVASTYITDHLGGMSGDPGCLFVEERDCRSDPPARWGRKSAVAHQPNLPAALEALIDDAIRGDPCSSLRWVSRSLRHLVKALAAQGFKASQRVVANLLRELNYSCQANRKTREGANHPDRDAQFAHINAMVKAAISAGEPAISVDTKKKELVGDFKNNGRELRPKGNPEPVRVHDFKIPELGKVAPYGVYDIAANLGWVSVGIDADTGAFAVESIRRWWQKLGKPRYPNAKCLTITADCGGSNGPQMRLWKRELQRFANEADLKITVTHLPPGTSKWNKIEHRLFAFITMNWRGKPLVSHQVIVQLIGSTSTETGLKVCCDRSKPLPQRPQGH